MKPPRVQAVCGSCQRQDTCQDAATLDQFRRFLESSRLAAEFGLASSGRYRLGCERYAPVRAGSGRARPPLRLVLPDEGRRPCA